MALLEDLPADKLTPARLWSRMDAETRRLAAVFGVIAFANVPFVHYAVRLWAPEQQLHPQNIELAPAMRQTLNLCFLAFFALFSWLLHLRYGIARDGERAVRLRQALEEE